MRSHDPTKSGTVLRVVIDRPDRGVPEKPESSSAVTRKSAGAQLGHPDWPKAAPAIKSASITESTAGQAREPDPPGAPGATAMSYAG